MRTLVYNRRFERDIKRVGKRGKNLEKKLEEAKRKVAEERE